MSLKVITNSVFEHLTNVGGLPAIFFSNTNDQPPAGEHIRPKILPNSTRTIGTADLDQEVGLIQISVYVKKGKGDERAAEIADAILAAFPRNLELTGLRIDLAGSAAGSFLVDGWQVTPTTIPYQNLA